VRIRKSAVGMKSASKMATYSPLATLRPAAMDVGDVDPVGDVAAHRAFGDAGRFVRGIVEDLDL
jgi:hypothetical protein